LHGCGANWYPTSLQVWIWKHSHGKEQATLMEISYRSFAKPWGAQRTWHGDQPCRRTPCRPCDGTDPDADRVGIAVRNHKNEMVLLNGNKQRHCSSTISWTSGKILVNSGATNSLFQPLSPQNFIRNRCIFRRWIFWMLTGLNSLQMYQAERRQKEVHCRWWRELRLPDCDFVRDKDAISACAIIAETAAWMADQGNSFWPAYWNLSKIWFL